MVVIWVYIYQNSLNCTFKICAFLFIANLKIKILPLRSPWQEFTPLSIILSKHLVVTTLHLTQTAFHEDYSCNPLLHMSCPLWPSQSKHSQTLMGLSEARVIKIKNSNSSRVLSTYYVAGYMLSSLYTYLIICRYAWVYTYTHTYTPHEIHTK